MTIYIIHSKQMWMSCSYSNLDRTLKKLRETMEHLDEIGDEYVISIDKVNTDFKVPYDEENQRVIE